MSTPSPKHPSKSPNSSEVQSSGFGLSNSGRITGYSEVIRPSSRFVSPEGWNPIENRKKLFPKYGQVEISGVAVSTLRPNDWLAFQIVRNARLRTISFKITAHNLIPRYFDMAAPGSLEAARSLFSIEGWADLQRETNGGVEGHQL
jgi:hypothetical protein